MKIHKYKGIEIWYDRSTKCWYGMRVDKNGYQIGDVIDAYTKEEIIWAIEHNHLN